ncbi:MAG: hypothetical protein U1E31_01395 [Rickettsiales bacterium]
MKLYKFIFIVFNCLVVSSINAENNLEINHSNKIDLNKIDENSSQPTNTNKYCIPENSKQINNDGFELKVYENEDEFNIKNAINYKNSAIQAIIKFGYHGIDAKINSNIDNHTFNPSDSENNLYDQRSKTFKLNNQNLFENYQTFFKEIDDKLIISNSNNGSNNIKENDLFYKHGLYFNIQLNYKLNDNITFGPFIEYEALYINKNTITNFINNIVASNIKEIQYKEKFEENKSASEAKNAFDILQNNINSFIAKKDTELNKINNDIFSHNISAGLAFGIKYKLIDMLSLYSQLGAGASTNINYNPQLIKSVNNKPILFIEAGANIHIKDSIEFNMGARYDVVYNLETIINTSALLENSNKFTYIKDKLSKDLTTDLKDINSYRIFAGFAINF